MALPNKLEAARMTNSTTASTIDNEGGDLETAISDILGIPIDTNISNKLLTVVAAGLTKVMFTDLAGSPSASGELARNGTALEYHNGTVAKVLTNGWELIQSQTASSSSTIDFTTGIDSDHDLYMVVLNEVVPATDDRSMALRVRQTTFQSGSTAYEYNHIVLIASVAGASNGNNSAGDTSILMTSNQGSAASEGLSMVVYFTSPDDTTHVKSFWWQGHYMDNTATARSLGVTGGGTFNDDTAAIDGIQFLFLTDGNIASGTFALYGLRK